MNLRSGRARRPDDWPSSHVRARADLSERLDTALQPAEDAWLDNHLDACPDCRSIEASYAAQRLELRALRDHVPPPPRDLWARTAAAIESEARFRDGRSRSADWRDRRYLAPSALLAAALVVAVVVGTLTSSRWFPSGGDAVSPGPVALGSVAAPAASSGAPGATPIPAERKFAYLTRDADGDYNINVRSVGEVCPETSTEPCATDATVENRPVRLKQSTSTVFGSPDDTRLIVVNDASFSNGSTVSVVPLESSAPEPTPTPTPSVSPTIPPATASAVATPSLSPSNAPPPSATPAVTPPPIVSPSPSPSVTITPSPDGSIEIANDVVLVGQSAAYSKSGDWFAFTARPVDGSAGPDIFVWKVGDKKANRVTSDQRSVFGSWSGDVLVGSTVVPMSNGNSASPRADLEPASFLLDPATATVTDLPQTGKAWRPAVDPRGRLAVYWSGTVRTATVPGFAPDDGRLVVGDWGATTTSADGPVPTTLKGDQVAIRHETTIADGPLDDWDARWDSTGTHLAVWIVDTRNPSVGRLSLYAVDSFDGRIDLKKPLLDNRVAAAGYSISDGKLVWAEPSSDGSAAGGTIQLLAWTDDGVGTVKTVTGPVIVIR